MFEGLFQPTHLLLVLAIALIVLGPGKLGDVGGQLGRGVREFRDAMRDSGQDRKELTARASCPSCGTVPAASAAFCHGCGARLNASAN